MRESAIEARLRKGVRKAGGLALKFVSPGNAGVPDRIVIVRGKAIFVELKADGGCLSPLQVEMHNRLRALGMDVRTLYGKDDVEGFLGEIQSSPLLRGRRGVAFFWIWV